MGQPPASEEQSNGAGGVVVVGGAGAAGAGEDVEELWHAGAARAAETRTAAPSAPPTALRNDQFPRTRARSVSAIGVILYFAADYQEVSLPFLTF
jgi:hypothetical protein